MDFILKIAKIINSKDILTELEELIKTELIKVLIDLIQSNKN